MDILKSVINKVMEDHQVKITIGAENKQRAAAGSKVPYAPFILGLLLGAGVASAGFLINESVVAHHASPAQAPVPIAIPRIGTHFVPVPVPKATTLPAPAPATAPEQKASAQNSSANQTHELNKIVGAGILTTIFGLVGRF